jgi:hypothetical protein
VILEILNDSLKNHISTFQGKVLKRLQNALSHRCIYPPLLGNQFPRFEVEISDESASNLLSLQIDPDVPIKSVPWELLESKHTQWEDLIRHYDKRSKSKNELYDIERLKFVYHFNPSEIYVGKAAFEGYVVFCFEAKERVVLECPKSGNAIYLMKIEDWKRLSQLSKIELLNNYRHDVSRILHSDKWRYELELWIEHGGIPLLEPLNID